MRDTMKKTVYLDMDGVLSDFVAGMCRLHRRENPYKEGVELQKQLDEFWEMDKRVFWKNAELDFWNGLDFMPDLSHLIHVLTKYSDRDMCSVEILTANSSNVGCKIGKIMWLENRKIQQIFNIPNSGINIEKEKWKFAHKNSMLIDDLDKNITKFNYFGGKTYLVPRPYNSNWNKKSYENFEETLINFLKEG